MFANPHRMIGRLIWRTPTEKFNPLMHLFFLSSFSYAVGFLLGHADRSSLYIAMTSLGDYAPTIWATALLAVVIINTIALMSRKNWMAKAVAYGGLLCWLFGSWGYLLSANYIVLFSVALPNFLFWFWYHFKVDWKESTARVDLPHSVL